MVPGVDDETEKLIREKDEEVRRAERQKDSQHQHESEHSHEHSEPQPSAEAHAEHRDISDEALWEFSQIMFIYKIYWKHTQVMFSEVDNE